MRIAIVNDTLIAVEAIRRVISSRQEHSVAWIAVNGMDAVARCAADRPDLVLMDLVMPEMDGVEATRRIMAASPCPVVVVTASVDDNRAKTFEAMGAGALDAVNTPISDGPEPLGGATALLGKIETIRKLIGAPPMEVGRALRCAPRTPTEPANQVGRALPCAPPPETNYLIAIGASAGGPAAIARILSQLPATFSAPIVIIQHVDAQFAPGLVDWLSKETRLPVELAQEGHKPLPGKILLAGADKHLVLHRNGRLGYTNLPDNTSYRPSIDLLFSTIAQHWPGSVCAVLLTGMGRDGAEGLRMLKEKGHVTIAQDQATSAVYGMPKAAVELQAVSEVLPLHRIGPRLGALVSEDLNVHG